MKSKLILLSLPLACLVLGGCKKDTPDSSAKPGENPVTAPADYIGAVGKAHKSAVKTAATASLDQAIKLFHEQEGRFPQNLEELVSSGTLPKLPKAPNGMKFEYDATTGKVKVAAE